MKKFFLFLSLSLAGAVMAQTPSTTDTPPDTRPHHRRFGPSPLVGALDANHDHVISADEIANAPAALLTLDKNGDGKLSADELRPAHAPQPPAGAPQMHRADPLMLALDANGDGELSAAEIANAPTSLKALDANKDGQLTPDEFRPLPPEGAARDCPPPHDGN